MQPIWIPFCGSQSASAKARPRPPPRCFAVLRFFGAHSLSARHRRRTSLSPPRQQRLRRYRHKGVFVPLPSADIRPRKGIKGGDTLSHARCHPDTANMLERVLRARETTPPRIIDSFFLPHELISFFLILNFILLICSTVWNTYFKFNYCCTFIYLIYYFQS